MSLNYTAPQNGKKEEVFYRGSKLIGTEFHTPEKMLEIHKKYEKLLMSRNFDEARKLESENQYLKTWLTSVIVDVMHLNGNGLIEILCDKFKDRGFDKEYYLNKFKNKRE